MAETATSFNVFYELRCENAFSSYVGLCYCTIWPSFFFDCFVKIWVTCKNFWTNGPLPPPGKKLPVRLWRQELLSGVFDSPWAKCVKLNFKESVADYSHGVRTHCTGLNLPRFESNRCRG